MERTSDEICKISFRFERRIKMNNKEIKWLHVFPINDLIDHNTESQACQYNPKIDVENMLVIHDSMDRREVFENGK